MGKAGIGPKGTHPAVLVPLFGQRVASFSSKGLLNSLGWSEAPSIQPAVLPRDRPYVLVKTAANQDTGKRMIFELGGNPLHAEKCMRLGKMHSGRILHRLDVGPNRAVPGVRNPKIRIAGCVARGSRG